MPDLVAQPLKVLIADDSPIIRERLQSLVTEIPGVSSVGFAEDGEQALELVERVRPDVLLLDLLMPKRTGLQVLEAVRARYPTCQVVVVTSQSSESCRWRCLERGAAAFVDKASGFERLSDWLRNAVLGLPILSGAVPGDCRGATSFSLPPSQT